MIAKVNPPLLDDYAELVRRQGISTTGGEISKLHKDIYDDDEEEEYYDLPVIDMSRLRSGDEEERTRICRASSEWGFFQLVNHGVSPRLLRRMRQEQAKLFEAPFDTKANCGLFNNSYRWGNRTATCPKQLSWNEAFHVPLAKISDDHAFGDFSSLREVMQKYAGSMQELAELVARILVRNLRKESDVGVLDEINCDEKTCFLRLNRYPPCPIEDDLFGLVPHTDSDFLTILHQDRVGGLQLMKDSKWVAVEPNQDSLIVNIGDLFQAWSNDVYKSVEHKVKVNRDVERQSIAYFLCPSYDSVIGSCKEPSVYTSFTFGEYRTQIQLDVRDNGHKVGLPRFRLLSTSN